jgi:hypothetical protein
VSLLDDVKQAVNGWFDAALGKPLDAALAKVRAAVSGRSVEQTVKPEVEAFFSAMTGWDQHLRRLEAAAAQISPPDPQVQAYVAAIRQKRDLLWTQATDPNAARPATSGAPVGFFPAIPAGTAVVFTAICAVAVARLALAGARRLRLRPPGPVSFGHRSPPAPTMGRASYRLLPGRALSRPK